jgi:hypothetical protein
MENVMTRGSMDFGVTNYGGARFSTMSGNEPGYATDPGAIKLQSLVLPQGAVDMIAAGKAVRILSDGRCEAIDGEPAGLIVFGIFKGDRPTLR